MASLSLSAKLNKKYLVPGITQPVYLMIDLEAKQPEAGKSRQPLNLGFVIDRSGSMSGEKIEYTKQAVQYAINHFAPQDTASLTVYDDEVQVLYPAQHVKFKDEFKGFVSQIFPGGMTNLSGGLVAGYREVEKYAAPDRVNRVLLLTDGLANRGITEPKRLCGKVAGMKKAGVTVTTLGVGDDFDEDLLTKMAEQSGGNYYFIDSTDHIPQIFAQELQALLAVVAQNVKVSFRCADAVTVTKVWNYPPSGDRIVEIGLPDLFGADHKIILLELAVTPSAEGALSLGTVAIAYDDAGEKLEYVSYGLDLSAAATMDRELLEQPEEQTVMLQVELNRTTEAREEAIRLADAGDFDAASSALKDRYHTLDAMECLAPEMRPEVALELQHLHEALAKIDAKDYDANLRKKMSYHNYQRRNTKKT